MLFPEEFINQVREENDIVDVISNYIPLKKGGANLKGLCPFHSEKTPSFMVSPAKQIFHCFGCGEGGNVLHFLMKHEKMGFPEAVRTLAERCGRPIPEVQRTSKDPAREKKKALLFDINQAAQELFFQTGKENHAAQAYLRERGISNEAISTFGIGYAPDSWNTLELHLTQKGFSSSHIEEAGLILPKKKGDGYYDRFRNRITFPIVDNYSRILGFGGRVLDGSIPKYLNSPETPVFDKGSNLYGLNLSYEAIRKQGYAILVEGYMDVITAHQNGIKNIVATLGTALTPGHLRKLRRYTRNLALFFDSDQAGLKAAERAFDLCVPEAMKVKVVTLPGGEDPDSFLRSHGKKGFSTKMAEAKPMMDFMIEQNMGETPPRELEEKVLLAERLTPLLAVIPNPIEQELYVRKTASLIGVDAGNLQSQVRSIVAKSGKKRDAKEHIGKKERESIPGLEGKFVGLMMNHPNLIRKIKTSLKLDYFSHPGLRSVVERIFELPEENLGEKGLKSIIQTEDTVIAGYLSKLYISNQEPIDLYGFIERLQLEHLKRRQKNLQNDVQVAEKQGRIQEVKQLIQKKSELSQEVEKLQQKLGSERRNVNE